MADSDAKENQPVSPHVNGVKGAGFATTQVKRSLAKGRRFRLKMLFAVHSYLRGIAETIKLDQVAMADVVKYFPDLKELIVASIRLCISLSLPSTKIVEIYNATYELGYYAGDIIVGLYNWCQRKPPLFGSVVMDLMEALVQLSAKNPETWLYSIFASPLVLQIINAFSAEDHQAIRSDWAARSIDTIKLISTAVFKCGDFCCQYFLMTIFSAWIQWASSANATALVNTVFSYVDGASRKALVTEIDVETRVRNFLNALNLSLRGPKMVIPVECLYIFVGENEIRPPKLMNSEANFWVDFSLGSGRLHVFHSIPGAPLASLSIRKDQIDSICLNWVVNDGRSQALDTQEIADSRRSAKPVILSKDDNVLFFHVMLAVNFDEVSRDVDELLNKGHRSIYFVFRNGELMEKVMNEMGYYQHQSGSKNCRRPKTLRHLLATQNKLSYTTSWCPDSEVTGLDETIDAGGRDISVGTPGRMSQNLDTSRVSAGTRTPVSCYSQSSTLQDTPNRSFKSLSNSSSKITTSQVSKSSADSRGTPYRTPTYTGRRTRRRFADLSSNSLNESIQTNAYLDDFQKIHPQTPSADGSAFNVSVSSEEEDELDLETSTENSRRLDSTCGTDATNFENPLPRASRQKYDHLHLHAPFQTCYGKENDVENLKNVNVREVAANLNISLVSNVCKATPATPEVFVRNSSPIPRGPQSFNSPAISAITVLSPPISMMNISEVDEDEQDFLENSDNYDDEMSQSSPKKVPDEHSFQSFNDSVIKSTVTHSSIHANQSSDATPPPSISPKDVTGFLQNFANDVGNALPTISPQFYESPIRQKDKDLRLRVPFQTCCGKENDVENPKNMNVREVAAKLNISLVSNVCKATPATPEVFVRNSSPIPRGPQSFSSPAISAITVLSPSRSVMNITEVDEDEQDFLENSDNYVDEMSQSSPKKLTDENSDKSSNTSAVKPTATHSSIHANQESDAAPPPSISPKKVTGFLQNFAKNVENCFPTIPTIPSPPINKSHSQQKDKHLRLHVQLHTGSGKGNDSILSPPRSVINIIEVDEDKQDFLENSDNYDDDNEKTSRPSSTLLNDSALSPVFGYSKILVNEDRPVATDNLTHPTKETRGYLSTPKSTSTIRGRRKRRETCYDNAYQNHVWDKLNKKPGYDPYNPLTSSEMEEFTKKILPPIKTYARKRKSRSEHRAAIRKRNKPTENLTVVKTAMGPKMKIVGNSEKSKKQNMKAEQKISTRPRKYSSFFKK